MYYTFTIEHALYGRTDYIMRRGENSTEVFIAHQLNPAYAAYEAWLAEGNEPQPWEGEV